MKLETLRCNHCGGPLTVPESANFVTCNHCNSQLAIRRTDSSTFTEELGEIKENQQQMMQQLAQIERQNQLEQIDREWDRERESYLTTNKNGRKSEPSEGGAVVFGVIVAAFGTFWTMTAFSITSRGPFHSGPGRFFPFFGFLFIVLGIGTAIFGFSKAKEYRAAQRRYQKRRSETLSETDGASDRYGTVPSIPTPDEYLERMEREENR